VLSSSKQKLWATSMVDRNGTVWYFFDDYISKLYSADNTKLRYPLSQNLLTARGVL
jgi:hypothetical protein